MVGTLYSLMGGWVFDSPTLKNFLHIFFTSDNSTDTSSRVGPTRVPQCHVSSEVSHSGAHTATSAVLGPTVGPTNAMSAAVGPTMPRQQYWGPLWDPQRHVSSSGAHNATSAAVGPSCGTHTATSAALGPTLPHQHPWVQG